MKVTLRTPRMTREQFLDWNEREEALFEFDGCEPVAMPDRTIRAALISGNILYHLCRLLEGTSTEVFSGRGSQRLPMRSAILMFSSHKRLGGVVIA